MTDANINLLHFNSCNYVQDFLLTLQSLNLAPCIDKPTRVHRNSFTLIDNIFTNKVNENIFSGNIISDISDHFSQFCLTSSLLVKGTPDRPLARNFSKFSEENFIHDLSRIDWVDIVSRNGTNIGRIYIRDELSRHIISAPLLNLINNSVQRGIFPSKLKHAKIIPIFKDGDEAEPGNYRPISLLSVFNRLFEKITYIEKIIYIFLLFIYLFSFLSLFFFS